MEAEGRVDDDVMLTRNLNSAFGVIKVFVQYRSDARAVSLAEFINAIFAPDKACDGRILDGRFIGCDEMSQDGTALFAVSRRSRSVDVRLRGNAALGL